MTESHTKPSGMTALDVDVALFLAAQAAYAWAHRHREIDNSARPLAALSTGAAYVNRLRVDRGLPIIPVGELPTLFETPILEWLPGIDEDFSLLDEGAPTPACHDLHSSGGSGVIGRLEQSAMPKIMDSVRLTSDPQSVYVETRRFLIEHAIARSRDAFELAIRLKVPFADLYQPVAEKAQMQRRGSGPVCFPCPRCSWPMAINRKAKSVSCSRSTSCWNAGSRFRLVDGSTELQEAGGLAAPTPVSSDGMVALREGLWRYTVLPGIEELQLLDELLKIESVQARLWPDLDAYDLHVSRDQLQWRVDVKDHATPHRIATQCLKKQAVEPMFLVVPDARVSQVTYLNRVVPMDQNYTFMTCSDFVRLVRGDTR